jgi:hypothetical protein
MHFVKDLGMPVIVTPPGDDFLVQLGETIDDRHLSLDRKMKADFMRARGCKATSLLPKGCRNVKNAL